MQMDKETKIRRLCEYGLLRAVFGVEIGDHVKPLLTADVIAEAESNGYGDAVEYAMDRLKRRRQDDGK